LYEVTTFRRDVETDGRRAVVEFSDTIQEDLARRDFTSNAIAWHPLRQELLDPSGGCAHLEARVLKAVGVPAQRFAEDYLRVLRALRFSGHFGFAVEEETWGALCEAVPHLDNLSVERVQEELMKVLSKAEAPSVALKLYQRCGALQKLYPELTDALAVSEPPSFEQVLAACDAVPRTRPLVRMAILLSPMVGESSSSVNAVYDRVEKLLVRLRCSNAESKRVAKLVANRTFGAPSSESVDIRRWLVRTDPALFPDLARIWLAEARVDINPTDMADGPAETSVVERIRSIRSVLTAKPPLSTAQLAVNGADLQALGLTPGPVFGEILERLLEHVLLHPEANTRSRLEALIEDEDLAGEARSGSKDDSR
jgi:tRNA nucleotidyltransferase/poly(A) polymerase